MKNFVKYAQYYNILYRDKNYREEADYVNRLIKRYSRRPNKTILDIGCGTGNHDVWFAEKGYQITGIDRSREMVTIARNKISKKDCASFRVCDVSNFNLNRKFDIAVSLFHVMSYLATDKTLLKGMKNIHKHLKNDSVFIFDFWYGPAVLAQNPVRKIKTTSKGNINISRIAIPKIDFANNTVDVKYKITVLNKNNGLTKIVTESHKMRYFFISELCSMLEATGFKVVKCLKWMSLKESPSEDSWSGVIIAKK